MAENLSLDGIKFSADLNVSQDQIRVIIAEYVTKLHGKTVLPDAVTFNIRGPTMGEYFEPSSPGSVSAKVKISL